MGITMSTSLDQLKATGTVVVSDSGDFATIGKYKPQDATTNLSLILAASKKPEYAALMDVAISYAKKQGGDIDAQIDHALDRLLVEFGKEILKIIPGKVSTEVDARFSFSTKESVDKALHIIKLYEEEGISKDRVLIKIASTWEGIKAANKKEYSKEEDPGVQSVKSIFNYYKKFGYKTIVMGASFRSVGEITELAGCDYLTISPNLLEDLINSTEAVPKKLDATQAASLNLEKKSYINDESLFRFDFNEDQMAVEKLREGISKFAADAVTLKGLLKEKLA